MNNGKVFEAALKKSVPGYALMYRLPDPAQSFGQSNKTRFSRHNPFDFILFSPPTRTMYAIEAKTVKGKSISFERCKDDHGEIHHYQINGLEEWGKYEGVIAGFIIDFVVHSYHRSHNRSENDPVRIDVLCEKEHCHCDDDEHDGALGIVKSALGRNWKKNLELRFSTGAEKALRPQMTALNFYSTPVK